MKNLPGIRKPMTTTPRWLVTFGVKQIRFPFVEPPGFHRFRSSKCREFLVESHCQLATVVTPIEICATSCG